MGNKSDLTHEITNHVIKKFGIGATRYATEVHIYYGNNEYGYIDFLTAKMDELINTPGIPKITCYEIKITWSDFNSENGHNFVGDENYYVLTKEVYERLMKEPQPLWGKEFVGIYVYNNGRLYKKKETNKRYPFKGPTITRRFELFDSILQRWIAGRVS